MLRPIGGKGFKFLNLYHIYMGINICMVFATSIKNNGNLHMLYFKYIYVNKPIFW